MYSIVSSISHTCRAVDSPSMAAARDVPGSIPGIVEFGRQVTVDTQTCIAYMRSHHLLTSGMVCVGCDRNMQLTARKTVSDGEAWYCSTCRQTTTIRKGSFFEVRRYDNRSRMTNECFNGKASLHTSLMCLYTMTLLSEMTSTVTNRRF